MNAAPARSVPTLSRDRACVVNRRVPCLMWEEYRTVAEADVTALPRSVRGEQDTRPGGSGPPRSTSMCMSIGVLMSCWPAADAAGICSRVSAKPASSSPKSLAVDSGLQKARPRAGSYGDNSSPFLATRAGQPRGSPPGQSCDLGKRAVAASAAPNASAWCNPVKRLVRGAQSGPQIVFRGHAACCAGRFVAEPPRWGGVIEFLRRSGHGRRAPRRRCRGARGRRAGLTSAVLHCRVTSRLSAARLSAARHAV